jgi:hypothetical protein
VAFSEYMNFMMIESNLVIRNFLVVTKLFTNDSFITIYEINWQIGQDKWFTFARSFTIELFFITKFECTKKEYLFSEISAKRF